MRYYKIASRSRPDRYRMSGIYPAWNKSGKTWDTLGKLRSMITMVMNSGREDLDDWQIIEYRVEVEAVKSVSDVITQEKLVDLLKRNKNG